MAENIMKVKAKKDRYDVTYMAGDDSGFDMMEGGDAGRTGVRGAGGG